MATPTTYLRVEKQANNENVGTWDQNLGVAFDLFDLAIAGTADISTTGGETTLADTQYVADDSKAAFLDISGTLASDATIVVPARDKIYGVRNATSGSYTVTIKTSTGTGVVIPQSSAAFIRVDSSDNDVDFVTAPTTGTSGVLPITQGGTGATTASAARSALGLGTGDSPTFTAVTVGATGFTVGSSAPFSDSSGTLTLQNIDALDATTETTIEAAIDTLANLTSVQGRTVTLADAGANAVFGWDDTAGAYENLTAAEATAILDAFIGDSGSGGTKGLVPAPTTGDSTKFLKGDGTWTAVPGGGDALTANPLSQFAATTSSELAGVISDETGSGALVFGTSPTFIGTVTVGNGTASGVVVRANGTVPTFSATSGLVVTRNVLAATGSSIEVSSGNAGIAEVLFSDTDAISRGRVQYDHATEKMHLYTESASRLTVSSLGVGIGTTSATQRLHIVASNASTDGIVISNVGGGATRFWINNTTEGLDSQVLLRSTSGGSPRYWSMAIDGSDSHKFKIDNNSTAGGATRVTIDSSGNVGIGTTSPSHLLTASATGTPTVATFQSDQSNAYVFLKDSGTTLANVRIGSVSNHLMLFAGGSERIRIDASGNVGIGTLIPSTTLHCNGPIRTASYTVATLPAAGTVGAGTRAYVTDANATTFASTVAGGGANAVPVYSDGTNWKIG